MISQIMPFHVTFSCFPLSMKIAETNRKMNKYLTQDHEKTDVFTCYSFLLPNVWEVWPVNNRKLNKCLTSLIQNLIKSDMSCHFTPFSFPMFKKLAEQRKENDQKLDSLNQKLVYQACLFKLLLFAAQCIRNLHCTLNTRKMNPYLTHSLIGKLIYQIRHLK